MRFKHLQRFAAAIACVGVLSSGVNAQDADSDPAAEAQDERRDSSADKSDAKKDPGASQHGPRTRKKTGRDDDVFRPSEEISEDFAVSFPVDI